MELGYGVHNGGPNEGWQGRMIGGYRALRIKSQRPEWLPGLPVASVPGQTPVRRGPIHSLIPSGERGRQRSWTVPAGSTRCRSRCPHLTITQGAVPERRRYGPSPYNCSLMKPAAPAPDHTSGPLADRAGSEVGPF